MAFQARKVYGTFEKWAPVIKMSSIYRGDISAQVQSNRFRYFKFQQPLAMAAFYMGGVQWVEMLLSREDPM